MAETKVTPAEIKNPYCFGAYRSVAMNSTGGTFVKIVLDTEEFDPNLNYDTTTGRYTVPVSGLYIFNWQVTVPLAGSSDTLALLYKNGSALKWGGEMTSGGGTNGGALVQASQGDYFEIYLYTSATVAVSTTQQKTYFNGFLTSAT